MIGKYNPVFRSQFRQELARHTPLINGNETKAVARRMGYESAMLKRIITEVPVPFEPRDTYPTRLMDWLEGYTD